MARARPLMIARVTWWWYLVPILPIAALGYAALRNWVPSWALLVAIFAFFMWLFSLAFALVATLTRNARKPRP